MKERLEKFMSDVNKSALAEHASVVAGKEMKMSEPFSAGQYWCCFELVADDGQLIIARVRLPPLPNASGSLDQRYRIECEVATIAYVRDATDLPLPRIFTYERDHTEWARKVGSSYMLIEGFYGNSLFDLHDDFYEIPQKKQEKVLEQWTKFQALLATLTFADIGAISQYSKSKGPLIGHMATDEAGDIGPFSDAWEYHMAIAEGRVKNARKEPSCDPDDKYHLLGPVVHLDIVKNSSLFKSNRNGPFPLNHLDMGTQNLLMDDEYNIVAIIDWEMAQTAPWEINYYQWPFPPMDRKDDVNWDSLGPVARSNTQRTFDSQDFYRRKFAQAEIELRNQGRPLAVSISNILDSDESRTYFMMERHGVDGPDADETYLKEAVKMAFGYGDQEVESYLRRKASEIAQDSAEKPSN